MHHVCCMALCFLNRNVCPWRRHSPVQSSVTGKCGETTRRPPSFSGPCVSKAGMYRPQGDNIRFSGCLLPGISYAAPPFSCIQPTHIHLNAGLAAGLFFPQAQSTARWLYHVEKCTGIVYVVVTCKKQWVGAWAPGFLDSNSSSATYSSLTLVGYLLPWGLTVSPVKWRKMWELTSISW